MPKGSLNQTKVEYLGEVLKVADPSAEAAISSSLGVRLEIPEDKYIFNVSTSVPYL